jgi:hypothetical protein
MERASINYMSLIDSYLALDNRRFIDYDRREINVEELCGTGDISETFDVSILEDMLEDGVSLLALRDEKIIGFFAGDIDTKKNILISEYTCATGGKKTGEFLRYYALLKAYEINDKITLMTGSASGGIPAIEKGDSAEVVKKKNAALINYHLKRGANLVEKMFTYTLTTVVKNIETLARGSSKRKITKKKKNLKGRKKAKKKRTYRKRF